MLSYSTGTSGSGVDVDAVVEATRLAREKAPDLALEGPILVLTLPFDEAVASVQAFPTPPLPATRTSSSSPRSTLEILATRPFSVPPEPLQSARFCRDSTSP